MREDWTNHFMDVAFLVATRSTCLRRMVGAVLVQDKRIIATGFNGAPKGLIHCKEVGCIRKTQGIPSGQRDEICRGVHAEINTIIQAAVHGAPVKGATLFCSNQPCSICAKVLINAEIAKVYYRFSYNNQLATEMLAEAGIELIKI